MSELTPRPVTREQVAQAAPLTRSLSASEAECAAVAERARIPAVLALAADWRLSPIGTEAIEAQGQIIAQLTLICRASGEPFTQPLSFSTRVVYRPAEQLGALDADDLASDVDEEALEEGESIDLAEATVQALLLEIPPFPRNPLASPGDLVIGESELGRPTKATPFAVLQGRFKTDDPSQG